MLIGAESIQIDEGAVAFEMSRRVDGEVLGVGIHALDLLGEFFGCVAEVDTVAERFAHFSFAVGSGESQAGSIVGEEDFRLDKSFTINIVETVNDFASKLNHRGLVFADRYGCSLEGSDVRRLADGVAEEANRNRLLKVAHLDFGFHRRVALHARNRNEIHVVERQFGQFGDMSLHKDGRLRRVETYRQIIERHLDNVLAHFLGVVGIIGKGLSIGNHDKNLIEIAGVLQLNTSA